MRNRNSLINPVRKLPPDRTHAVLRACLDNAYAPREQVLEAATDRLLELCLSNAAFWAKMIMAEDSSMARSLLMAALDPGRRALERIRAGMLAMMGGADDEAWLVTSSVALSLNCFERSLLQEELRALDEASCPPVWHDAALLVSRVDVRARPVVPSTETDVSIVLACRGPAGRRSGWVSRVMASLSTLRRAEVLVLDDASGYGDLSLLDGRELRTGITARVEPTAHHLRSLSSAWGRGLEATSSELVCLVADDIETEPGCLDLLLCALEGTPSAGLAAPVVLGSDGTCKEAGIYMFEDGKSMSYGAGRPRTDPSLASPRVIHAADMACVAVRRSAILEAGGFSAGPSTPSERAQAAELGVRLDATGWDLLFVPGPAVIQAIAPPTPPLVAQPAGASTTHRQALTRKEPTTEEPPRAQLEHVVEPHLPGAGSLEAGSPGTASPGAGSPGRLDKLAWGLAGRGGSPRRLGWSWARSTRAAALLLDPAPGGIRTALIAESIRANGVPLEVFCFGAPMQDARAHYGARGVRIRSAPELADLPFGDAVLGVTGEELLHVAVGQERPFVYVTAPAVTRAVLEALTTLPQETLIALESGPLGPAWVRRWVEERSLAEGRVVIVTKRARSKIEAAEDAWPQPVVTIPEAADAPALARLPAEPLGHRVFGGADAPLLGLPDRRAACFPGRFSWGPHRLGAIWCMEELLGDPRLSSGMVLGLVGHPGCLPILEQPIADVEGGTLVAGPGPCLPWLASARVAVLPVADPLGAAWAEPAAALAVGTPLVVTPQVAEQCELAHGKEVLVASSGRDFTRSMARLMEDDTLWEEMHATCLSEARERYPLAALEAGVRRLLQLLDL